MFNHRVIELQCPKCGATMEWNELEHLKVCKHCGYAAKEVDKYDFARSVLLECRKRKEQAAIEKKQRAEEARKREEEDLKKTGKVLLMCMGLMIFMLLFFRVASSILK